MKITKFVFAFILLTKTIFLSFPEETLPDDIRQFLDEYRKEKSICFALSGEKIVDSIAEKYWHNRIVIIFDEKDKAIYIISDDYSIDSFTIEKDKVVEYRDRMFKLLKTAKEDSYRIKIIEKTRGIINNNQTEYYPESKKYEISYTINRTDTGLKIMSDVSFVKYRILESDVPLLLERLQK
jgi:hypothetical protein